MSRFGRRAVRLDDFEQFGVVVSAGFVVTLIILILTFEKLIVGFLPDFVELFPPR